MAVKPDEITDLVVRITCPACNQPHNYGGHNFKPWPPKPGTQTRLQCQTFRTANPTERFWNIGITHITIQF